MMIVRLGLRTTFKFISFEHNYKTTGANRRKNFQQLKAKMKFVREYMCRQY